MSNHATYRERTKSCRRYLHATRKRWSFALAVALSWGIACLGLLRDAAGEDASGNKIEPSPAASMLVEYYAQMSVPKPFVVRNGQEFKNHQHALREMLLESTGLWPLPERIPLDVHQSEPLDHPWCTVRRVAYQLWPGVYSSGLLYMPKQPAEAPAPAMLCPHGHWKDGNAHPVVQTRCLSFARMGYIAFSSTQNHYEDLSVGVSHQTLMIWNNMRALDYLETLPQVDKTRIGAAGASGGGLQTEMLTALDPRVKAATIVGLTCDFREIMFPDRHHCTCNHFPGVMQFADHPEISALGLPAPIQYLTMNDWTRNFERDNLPTIRELYGANALPDRVDFQYYDTPHTYDKPKRERTYWWMERWLRGNESEEAAREPDDVKTFPVETLTSLSVDVPGDKGFEEIGKIYRQERGYRAPSLSDRADWCEYRARMLESLGQVLGEHAKLPRETEGPRQLSRTLEGDLVVERVGYPSEGGIVVPTIVLRGEAAAGKLPVVLLFDKAGRESLRTREGPDSASQLARGGSLVVLPDVRTFGDLFSTGGKDEGLQRVAWERNAIVWGRPILGMACTDVRGVLDGLASRPDADMTHVTAIARNGGALATAVLFAAALDSRITRADVDLEGCCFEKRNLPLVPRVLQHGDVLQWAALLADRRLTIRNVPPEAGDVGWLAAVFAAVGNPKGLDR